MIYLKKHGANSIALSTMVVLPVDVSYYVQVHHLSNEDIAVLSESMVCGRLYTHYQMNGFMIYSWDN
jgi:hypothetical protein